VSTIGGDDERRALLASAFEPYTDDTPPLEEKIAHAAGGADGDAGPAGQGARHRGNEQRVIESEPEPDAIGKGDRIDALRREHRESMYAHTSRVEQWIEQLQVGERSHSARVNQLASKCRVRPRARLEHVDPCADIMKRRRGREADEATSDDDDVRAVRHVRNGVCAGLIAMANGRKR
jgi:hypothetical protein